MAERYPEGMHGAIAAGLTELLGRPGGGAHRHPGPARARADRRGARRHRRPHLVGPRPPRRRRRRRGRRRSTSACSAGWACWCCTRRTSPRSSSELMGTTLLAAVAQLRRHRAGLERRRPSHPIAEGVPHPIVIDEQEMYGEYFDIPAPDELVFLSTLHRRRGVPLRLHLAARQGQGLLLLPRRPGLPRLPPPRHQAGAGQRRAVGAPRRRRATAPRPAVVNEPAPVLRRRQGAAVDEPRPWRRAAASCAPASSASAGPASSTWTPTTARPTSSSSRWPAWRPTRCRSSATSTASPRTSRFRDWQDLVARGEPRRRQHRHPDGAARADRRRRAGRGHPRAVARSRWPRTPTGAQTMVAAAEAQRPGARRLVQPPPARRRAGAEEDRRRRACSATSTTPRPAGCGARASRASAAGSPGGRPPAAVR